MPIVERITPEIEAMAGGAGSELSRGGMRTKIEAARIATSAGAHMVIADGRITIMFCSFEGNPLIVRLYGTGEVIHSRDAAWNELHPLFPSVPGERQIIVLNIESIMATCGFAVPLFQYQGERNQLLDFACKMGDERMDEYRHERNQVHPRVPCQPLRAPRRREASRA